MRQDMPAGPEAMQLLRSIAEQLKLPLTNIARRVELERLRAGAAGSDLANLSVQTTVALQLVDSYLLGLQLAEEQGTLALEPVSVASTLTDTAHELQALAKQYGVALEVRIDGRYEPVMAHPAGLKAALLSLGYALVEAEAAQASSGRLVLAAHRNRYGIVAGLYGEQTDLQAGHWRTALALCGRAHRPLADLSAGSGAGLFVADTILQAMATRLRVGRHARRVGLSATLLPSQQLQLV